MVKQKKEEVNNMNEKTVSVLPVRQLCLIALMAALMCLLGPLARSEERRVGKECRL